MPFGLSDAAKVGAPVARHNWKYRKFAANKLITLARRMLHWQHEKICFVRFPPDSVLHLAKSQRLHCAVGGE